MGAKMSVSDLKEADLKGKIVFVKVDLNVLLGDNSNCCTRDRDALPIIKHLMVHGAKVILSGHLGSRKDVNTKNNLKSLVPRLSDLLGTNVHIANDIFGANVANSVDEIQEGGVLLIENVYNDVEFGKKLASLVDLYVHANGTANRASTERMTKYLKSFGKKFAFKAFCCWLPEAVVTLTCGDALDEIAETEPFLL